MAQLVPNVKSQALGIALHGIGDVRCQHHIPIAKKFGRESVEHAIAVQDVGFRRGSDIESLATFEELRVQVGKLFRRELNSVPLHMSDQS